MKFPRIILGLLFLLTLGCSTERLARWVPEPYKLDIPQGNIVTQEKVNRLRPGMTRQEVRAALGTPLLDDPLHPNRWEYLYSLKENRKPLAQRRLAVLFEKDELVGLEGDFRPGDPADTTASNETTVEVPKRDLSSGIFNRLRRVFTKQP